MNIYVPEQKKLVVPVGLGLGMKGFMRMQVWRPDQVINRCRIDTGWFPNKLLNSGRNQMSQRSDWMNYAQVGTNNTPALATDTGLLSRVAGTSTIQSNSNGTQGSAPYYGWKRKTFRFGVGAGHGGFPISEGGVGWSATGANLISRALILDPITQLETTVSPLVDELLDLSYELRYYPPLADVNQSVTLDGLNYDVITRASEVTSSSYWSADIGAAIGQYALFNSDWRAYDGNIGTILQEPSGVAANCDNEDQFNQAYSNNSYQQDMQCNTGSAGWNLGAGIRSIRIKTTAGAYQSQFTRNPGGQTIPKTSSFTMEMVWRLGWTEVP